MLSRYPCFSNHTTEFRDELTRIDGAITRATISDKIGARVISGLTEKTISFPRQTGQMSAEIDRVFLSGDNTGTP